MFLCLENYFTTLTSSADSPVFESIIGSSVNWITGFVRVLSREILGNAFKVFYLLAVVTVSSFFIVRDGHLIRQYVKDIMPSDWVCAGKHNWTVCKDAQSRRIRDSCDSSDTGKPGRTGLVVRGSCTSCPFWFLHVHNRNDPFCRHSCNMGARSFKSFL